MKLFDYTFAKPEENLAFDDAILDAAEAGDLNDELLRFWEPLDPMVVIGRSSRISDEVNLKFCETNEIPVFRRVSGGAAIVTGPGCLMYALLLSYEKRPQLRMLDQAHQFVMQNFCATFATIQLDVQFQGTCDLTINNRKFSGNSLRCKRNWMLYHGTILHDFDLGLIASCLKTPPRQPEYRQQRDHESFVGNLKVEVDLLKNQLIKQFRVDGQCNLADLAMTQELAQQKYSSRKWNEQR